MSGRTSANPAQHRRRGGRPDRLTRRRTHPSTYRRLLRRRHGRNNSTRYGTKAASIGSGLGSDSAQAISQPADTAQNLPERIAGDQPPPKAWPQSAQVEQDRVAQRGWWPWPVRTASTGLDQSTPQGSLPSRSPVPMPRIARLRVSRCSVAATGRYSHPVSTGAGTGRRRCRRLAASTAGNRRWPQSR
ncbi:MAG: hypothetical protein QOH34_151 [Mycobacterium sp.]|nr:hypothetical protein [Mycobacterium sp.]